MLAAVIIPFRGNPDILQWTLQGFAQQILPPDFRLEIRLCADGVPIPTLPASDHPDIQFSATGSPHVGVAQAKNILLQNRPADVVIFANSDTRPIPTFVAAHLHRLLSLPESLMVLGSSPFEQPPNPTILDTLLQETPMIFFYPNLIPHQLYDFRHAWNLNLSARYRDLARINFFQPLLQPYGYEDLDLAFRLLGPTQKSIYFEPAAEVLHRHPMTLPQYLDREELLGRMTPTLFSLNPALFQTLHQTSDLEQLADQAQTWTQMDLSSHQWILRRLSQWATQPAATLPHHTASRSQLLQTIYQMHIPLKRLAFRLGLLESINTPADWRARTPTSLWQSRLAPQ